MANDKWEELKAWVIGAVNDGLARGADYQTGRDKGMYEAYKNVADKMCEMDGGEFVIIECDGRCLNCDNYGTSGCPDRH